MLFKGIGRTFSTENDQQYETIGAFWDELAAKYGRENLQGLGYGWKERRGDRRSGPDRDTAGYGLGYGSGTDCGSWKDI